MASFPVNSAAMAIMDEEQRELGGVGGRTSNLGDDRFATDDPVARFDRDLRVPREVHVRAGAKLDEGDPLPFQHGSPHFNPRNNPTSNEPRDEPDTDLPDRRIRGFEPQQHVFVMERTVRFEGIQVLAGRVLTKTDLAVHRRLLDMHIENGQEN